MRNAHAEQNEKTGPTIRVRSDVEHESSAPSPFYPRSVSSRGGGGFNLPASLNARRKINSTCAFTLRRSSAAQRSMASHKAGSTRKGYCLRFAISSPHRRTREQAQVRRFLLLVERARVQHGLRVRVSAKDHHQVRNHSGLALVVQVYHVLAG